MESSGLENGAFSEPKSLFVPCAYFWGLFSESFRLIGLILSFLHRMDQFSLQLPKLIVSMFPGLPADKQRNATSVKWGCQVRLNPAVVHFNQGFNLSVMTIKFLLLSLTWVHLLSEYFQKSTKQTLVQIYSTVFFLKNHIVCCPYHEYIFCQSTFKSQHNEHYSWFILMHFL